MKLISESITTITITDDETGETVEKTIDQLLDDVFGPEDGKELDFDVEDDFDSSEEELSDIDDSDFDFLSPDEGDQINPEDFPDLFDELPPEDAESADEPFEDDALSDVFSDDTGDAPTDEFPEDTDDTDSEFPNDDVDELSPEVNEFGQEVEEVDPSFQGEIRTVTGANLVYKRQDDGGTYEELWIYNVGDDVKAEVQIRRAILAGTDILPSNRESEDGSQQADTYTVGNIQFLKLTGLPN